MNNFNSYFFPILLASLILVIYGYIFYIRKKRQKEDKDWKKKLNQLVATPEEERQEALSLIKQTPSDFFLESKLQKVEGLHQWIQQAGLTITPSTFVGIFSGMGIFIFFIFFLYLGVNFMTSSLIGVVFSFVTAWGVLTFLRNKRKELFLKEFPIALDIMRRALRAGFSTEKALEMIAEQQKGLIGKAFKMISDKIRLCENN